MLPQRGLPPLPPTPSQQQQQQRLVQVSAAVDAAGARALALHQLTGHMCHAWLLLYCCCCWMLLPSLIAWLKLPLGELLLLSSKPKYLLLLQNSCCFLFSFPLLLCGHKPFV
jgi:hypothetical protein